MKAEVMQATLAGGAGKADERAGKYLTFQLGNEEFAIQVLKVREIMGVQEITAVPQTPVFVKGVINLRGKVIPVVDLRLKFGLPEAAYTQRTCIIVVQVPGERGAMLMGIVVDGVSDVLTLTPEQIRPAPEFGAGVDTQYIIGLGTVGERMLILMDIEDDTAEINRIADIVNAYNTTLARHALLLGCDAVAFGDDLGTQNALMISPPAFRRFFKPRYKELFDSIRRERRGVFFHSCGQVTDVLEDLREVGVTALWPQLPLYDLRELARRCRDLGIAVQLHPDRGHLMQHGSPGEIRDYVLRLLDTFDTARGGSWLFIEIDPGFPWVNVEALFSVAMEVRAQAF